jgi:N-carbamoyl-L-amino-acid hydrolase
MERFKPNLERICRDITTISKFATPDEPGSTRISFSEEYRQARNHVALLMENEAKLNVRIDPAGNLIGRREGKRQKPAILVGSHLDTVQGGGKFDGVSGVISGIEIARRFEEKRVNTIHPLEIVVFLAEEPSPFGISTVGSRGMAGVLKKELLTSLKDNKGRTLGMAIREMGGEPAKIAKASRYSDDVLAYLELHIEQGPILFSRGIPIGVVTGIVGITRGKIEIIGRADHSGTTPMDVRKDALAAASEVVLALEKVCTRVRGVVGTIGRVEVFPNSLNVIPGTVILGMEMRSLSEGDLNQTVSLFEIELDQIRDKRGIIANFETEVSSKPVIFNSRIVDRISRICEQLNISHLEMPSWAGHDASHLARIAPTGMIFIPTKDGRSHCPDEWSEFEHICLGTEVLAWIVAEIDREEAT